MPIESATYVAQLNDNNPVHTDPVSQGDAHIRLVKAALVATFPLMNGECFTTVQQMNEIAIRQLQFTDGASNNPGLGYNADRTAGFYRSSTGHQTIVGRLQGNGAVPVGSMHWFPADPGTTLVARGGTATGTEQYLECDGSVYQQSTFPDLAASGLVVLNGGGFFVPNLGDTGRFMRSRKPGVTTLGATQANQNQYHTHGVTDGGHVHGITDTGHIHTATDSGHFHQLPVGNSAGNGSNFATCPSDSSTFNTTTNSASISVASHTTGISVNSATTGISVNAQGNAGDTEARPEAFIGMCVIKT